MEGIDQSYDIGDLVMLRYSFAQPEKAIEKIIDAQYIGNRWCYRTTTNFGRSDQWLGESILKEPKKGRSKL